MSFAAQSAKNISSGELQYHLRLRKGDIPPYVLIPGDPARVNKIAQTWDSSQEVANYRQYHTMKGIVSGAEIACTSSGIGAPGLTVALEELAQIGAHTFIRVGTCGSLQPNMRVGDLVISTGGVRLEGASKEYVRVEYPAVADYKVVDALVQAAEKVGARYHVGITASTDTFYAGQGRPGFNNYLPSFQEHLYEDLKKANVANFEMEASCLLTLSSIFGLRAGCVCVVIADRVRDEFKVTDEMEMQAAQVANEAVRILQSTNT